MHLALILLNQHFIKLALQMLLRELELLSKTRPNNTIED